MLGKKLGKAMGAVAGAIKTMDVSQILRFEAEGKITLNGVELVAGDLKVARDFKRPEGTNEGEVDAEGDGEVLVVLDLAVDLTMQRTGIAREVVNRFQKLRKKTGVRTLVTCATFSLLSPDEWVLQASSPRTLWNSSTRSPLEASQRL